MVANGVVVDIKTGKPENEQPAEVKQEAPKSNKKDKK